MERYYLQKLAKQLRKETLSKRIREMEPAADQRNPTEHLCILMLTMNEAVSTCKEAEMLELSAFKRLMHSGERFLSIAEKFERRSDWRCLESVEQEVSD